MNSKKSKILYPESKDDIWITYADKKGCIKSAPIEVFKNLPKESVKKLD